MVRIYLVLALSLLSNAVFSQETAKKKGVNGTKSSSELHTETNDSVKPSDIEIKTFQIDKGWGFDLLVNDKKYIHQTNIPAINGLKTFKTKEDAVKIAQLMKSKMLKNIFPPFVTVQEIDSLITVN